MTKAQRERAQFLVDLYLTWRLSTHHDAGWHGEHVLGRLVQFRGDLPPSSGNDQSDLKMIGEVRWLRHFHRECDYAVNIMLNMQKRTPRLFAAVLLDRYARKRTFRQQQVVPGEGVKAVDVQYTTAHLADVLGVSVENFRQMCSRGYGYIEGIDNGYRMAVTTA